MRTLLLVATASLLVLVALPCEDAEAQQSSMQVRYQGELIDQHGRPLTGVYPLSFALYVEGADAPLWTEDRYVAVQGGMYELLLGRSTPLSSDLAGRDVELVVSMDGAGELSRTELLLTDWTPPPVPEPARLEHVTFADLVGRAIVADTADFAQQCRTLSGRTARELDRYADLQQRLTELRRMLVDGQETTVGTETVQLERIGGTGGVREMIVRCPPGYIVTGARGGVGQVMDSLQLVCTRIE